MKFSVIFALQLMTAFAVCKENNCTVLPCMSEHNRRQWPILNFDFYRDSSNTVKQSTELPPEYSSQFSTPKPTSSEMRNVSTVSNSNLPKDDSGNIQINCQNISEYDETLKRLDWIKQSYLLRSVFRQQSPNKTTNLREHFRNKLLRVYRMATEKQRRSNQSSRIRRASQDLNVTIWDIQTTKNIPEVDVIYLLSRDNVPVLYDDASKLLSFLDREIIENITEYKVVHKVLRKYIFIYSYTSFKFVYFSLYRI